MSLSFTYYNYKVVENCIIIFRKIFAKIIYFDKYCPTLQYSTTLKCSMFYGLNKEQVKLKITSNSSFMHNMRIFSYCIISPEASESYVRAKFLSKIFPFLMKFNIFNKFNIKYLLGNE